MRLANSAACGQGGISAIPAAILKVGAANLANMVLALSVVEVFVPRTQGRRNLWIHSIQTALVASRLSNLRPDMGLTAEECFLAGLLHDIGRFVIFEHRPQEMAQLDEAEVTDPRELVEAERRPGPLWRRRPPKQKAPVAPDPRGKHREKRDQSPLPSVPRCRSAQLVRQACCGSPPE